MDVEVLDHQLDVGGGVYRITLAEVEVERYYEEEDTGLLDPDEKPLTRLVPRERRTYFNQRTVTFDSEDERWFVAGHRRSDEEVTAEQIAAVRAALTAARELVEDVAAEIRQMPGVGTVL